MEVTLDTNAVIALANDARGKYEKDAEYLKPLLDYHRQGLITLSIGRVTFLEAMPKDTTEPEHVVAEKRIVDAGLNIDRVQLYRSAPALGFYCLSCNAYIYFGNPERIYAQLIHDVIAGKKKVDLNYYQYRERRINDPEERVEKDWNNHFNDVWGLIEHVKWGGDIFVTSDDDFLKKRDKLATIVPGKILRPKEALEELSKMSLPLPPKPAWQPCLVIAQCMHCSLKHQVAS